MREEDLLKALAEGDIQTLLYRLNEKQWSADELATLAKAIDISHDDDYIPAPVRKNIISFYQCEAHVDNIIQEYNQALENIQRLPPFLKHLGLEGVNKLFKSAAQDKNWEEILTMLAIRRFCASLNWLAGGEGMLSLLKEIKKSVKDASSVKEMGIIVAILQEVLKGTNFAVELPVKKLLLLLNPGVFRKTIECLKELSGFLNTREDNYLSREIFFNQHTLYGIPLSTLHLRDIPEFIQSPKEFLKKEGASLKKQLAVDLLKAQLDAVFLRPDYHDLEEYYQDLDVLQGRFWFVFKSALEECYSIEACEFLYTALTSFGEREAEKILNEDAHTFTDEQAKCYEKFMERLLDSEKNLYFKASLNAGLPINEIGKNRMKVALQVRKEEIKQLEIETKHSKESDLKLASNPSSVAIFSSLFTEEKPGEIINGQVLEQEAILTTVHPCLFKAECHFQQADKAKEPEKNLLKRQRSSESLPHEEQSDEEDRKKRKRFSRRDFNGK